MSGTQLGRIMAEVTAQPPVDVDFAAVGRLVRRRRRRAGAVAGGATAMAVALIVGLSALGGAPRQAQQHRAPAPPGGTHPAVRQDSWNSLTWAIPSDWPASDAYPDHSRPSNAFIEGPYVGSVRVPVASPTPRPVQGSGVLASAGPSLPSGAVVAWFSYGERADPLASGNFDAEAPKYLPAECTAMGASQTFHATRQFGTAAAGSNVSLDGCINATDATTAQRVLGTILASVRDSAYPDTDPSSTPAASPVPSPPSAIRSEEDGLSWRTPSGWLLSSKPVAATTVDHVTSQHAPYISTTALNPACVEPLDGLRCARAVPIAALGAGDAIAELSVSSSKNIEGDAGQFYPPDNNGNSAAPDPACYAIGGGRTWTWSHLFGPRSNAVLVTLSACVGLSASSDRIPQLSSLADSLTVEGFPDLNAGTEHPTLLPRPPATTPAASSGIAAGTTAKALCGSALGTYATAQLTTVGDVRSATPGPPPDNGKGRLADAFPGAQAGDKAAWCWTLPAHNIADVYAVHAGDRPALLSELNGVDYPPGQVPSGVPAIP